MYKLIYKFKYVFKFCIIPYIFCILAFHLNPSLNLSKLISYYEQFDAVEVADIYRESFYRDVFRLNLTGCILTMIIITLIIYIFKFWGFKKMLISIITIFVITNFLAPFGFPSVPEIARVWGNDINALYYGTRMYMSLLYWLDGWVIMLALSIYIYYKIDKRNKLNKPKK